MTRTAYLNVRADRLRVGDVFIHGRHNLRCTVTDIRPQERTVAIVYEMTTSAGNVFRATRIALNGQEFRVEG